MSSTRDKSALQRSTKFETFEARIVFSVDSVVADLVLQAEIDQQDVPAQYSLSAAHESTGAEYVFSDYGFDGSGQTIAVIDTGIAWDHYALGGGFGEDYRVIGGWDFAEGDSIPYDDGPAGYHGTHVAGIIGSDDANNRGVASGTDLVSLRVFDDNGTGNLDWVEQALQWVHDHKDDFANPITTVNLSLGVDWNADNVPGWATLEDEFAQLEADNIFISVAAGNAFGSYNSSGLAYPAVSDHVVPVASHGVDGSFSNFSQRNDRVLVAPGESIQSTVPGHLFGSAQSNGFLGASGTSMAAPYVAGASAVLREAMQFMGYENIDQDMLYDHFRETATQFYDSVTSGVYHRLDLGAAVDAVVNDAHGAAASSATGLGTIGSSELIHGTIGKLTDVDAFSFTAGKTGQLLINISETQDLVAVLKINGQTVSFDGNTAAIDVVAGQNYTMSLSTANGIGHYNLDLDINETIDPNVSLVDGLLKVTGTEEDDHISIDHRSDDGQIHITFGQTNYQFAVDQVDRIVVDGLAGSNRLSLNLRGSGDEIYLVADDAHVTTGDFSLSANGFDSISVVGDSTDKIVFLDSAGNDTFTTSGTSSLMTGSGFHNTATGITSIQAVSRDGNDVANIDGSASADHFTITKHHTQRNNAAGQAVAVGFSEVNLEGQGGNDSIVVHGSDAVDQFVMQGNNTRALLEGVIVEADGIEKSIVVSNSDQDSVTFIGTDGDDQLYSSESSTIMNGDGYHNVALNIRQVIADVSGGGGHDTAWMSDTTGDDLLTGNHHSTRITGGGYDRQTFGFDSITVVAENGGTDRAVFTGTRGKDTMLAEGNSTWVWGGRYHIGMVGFENVSVDGNGGSNAVLLRGDSDDTNYHVTADVTQMNGNEYSVTAKNFGTQRLDGGGGQNVVSLEGFDEDDRITADGSALLAWLDGNTIHGESFIWLEAETEENHSSAHEINAVDFWYALHGDWTTG